MIRICLRCKKREHVQRKNPSEYCTDCQVYLGSKKSREKRLEEHRCVNCGNPVQPIKCPHCKGVLHYNVKCKECREKGRVKV